MKDKLVFIDVYVDKNEHVYPMQVAGQSMRDMWLAKGADTFMDNETYTNANKPHRFRCW